MLVFAGYSFILIIDRVMFDSHALFEHGEEGHGHGHDDHDEEKIKKVPSINHRATEDMGQPLNHHDNEGGSHHHHGGVLSADPAAQKMIKNIAVSVSKIHVHEKSGGHNGGKHHQSEEDTEEIIQEGKAEEEINDNIKTYLSRAD